ncbi:unnamed protein product [Laminaria digitata]
MRDTCHHLEKGRVSCRGEENRVFCRGRVEPSACYPVPCGVANTGPGVGRRHEWPPRHRSTRNKPYHLECSGSFFWTVLRVVKVVAHPEAIMLRGVPFLPCCRPHHQPSFWLPQRAMSTGLKPADRDNQRDE